MAERRTTPGKVTDAELLAAAERSEHMHDLLTRLGIAAHGANYESTRRRLERLGALEPRFRSQPRRRVPAHAYSDDALRDAVTGAVTKADVLRRLGRSTSPVEYPALNARLAAAGVDTRHLQGRAWSRGRSDRPKTPLSQVLRPGTTVSTHRLRRRLLADGVFEHRCSGCGGRTWNGRPIPLELDHVDGDRTNNALENLRLLCPNCHAQTDTYRGRNVGRGPGHRTPAAVGDCVSSPPVAASATDHRPDGVTRQAREA